jgi:hypothetical protein
VWRRVKGIRSFIKGGELDAEKVKEIQHRRLVVDEGTGKKGYRIL